LKGKGKGKYRHCKRASTGIWPDSREGGISAQKGKLKIVRANSGKNLGGLQEGLG
jgi:hypothetical protein